MYAIHIKAGNADFIAKYLNNGVVPEQTSVNSFFVFGDDKPGEILTAVECAKRFGPRPSTNTVVMHLD
jgi:hypothetical protein